MKNNFLIMAIVAFLVACGGGGEAGPQTSADDALTNRLGFPAGSSVTSGSPRVATNNAGDVTLTAPTNTDTLDPTTGTGNLAVTFTDMPADSDFDVNVQFGSSTSFVKIPVSSTTTGGATGGTLNIPFDVPPNICDNVADIQHQISCYESIDVGNGVMVSQQTARNMLLACDTNTGGGFATGVNDFCADDYPQEACTIINSDPSTASQFKTNTSCAAGFPGSTVLGTYGCAGSGLTPCGACAVQVTTAKPAASDSSSDTQTLEGIVYEQLLQYQADPAARRRITFTPAQ